MSTTESGYRESSVDGLLEIARGKVIDASKRERVSLAVVKDPEKEEYVHDQHQMGDVSESDLPGRLAVIGDADWLDETFLAEQGFANRELLSSLVGWLTERKALISVAPRKTDAQSIIMSDADLGAVFFRVVVLIPLAFLFAGFAMWWSRRS